MPIAARYGSTYLFIYMYTSRIVVLKPKRIFKRQAYPIASHERIGISRGSVYLMVRCYTAIPNITDQSSLISSQYDGVFMAHTRHGSFYPRSGYISVFLDPCSTHFVFELAIAEPDPSPCVCKFLYTM